MKTQELVQKYKSNSDGITVEEQLLCIEEYIKDKKIVDVKINPDKIRTPPDVLLLHVAFCKAFDYLTLKYEEDSVRS